ncbi:putative TIR domain, P-loop containing nucleoside triphosphate hydrolase [Rosa chinensis]|uniref:ADP-ribosyl cyclase/cyclic ADP-ribose hydrolase n=1 Tax=Rosa chinensis TaxID=74649 RepID=A0A2P6SAM6_ROSCH|nr:disease resistance-like protein DSC1 [Rosa chinensis]PRQ55711.1 putative TIR domain, P-loop containing nucleoside triphosphate hydrolase [Rosa chinensis]
MASSSSPPAHAFKYDVFLSFRGEDTRNTFTSHLHAALVQKKIETYIDYELVRGEEIAPALLKAIEESKLSVVILSQDYASSTWCLDELAHILECKERHGQIVIPIFYRTDPSHVRHQRESYAAAFVQHEERFKDKVLKWREALTKASKLAGFDSRSIGLESELVELVVKYIVKKLSRECSSDLKGLVGIESRIQQLESLLCIDVEDVRVRTVGIWGMGGVGKTTLAGVVFNRLSSQFEASYFLADVREKYGKDGLHGLRDELFRNLLKDESLRIGTPSIGSTLTKQRLSRTKVLVVLDDVNDVRQLETLVGDQVQFGPGSRIIITTRDMHQLREMQQLHKGANHDVLIYKAKELDRNEALQLFHLSDSEEISCGAEYTELVRTVVHYAAGIPLALKIWGSLFRRCKSTQERESFLKKLKRFPEKKLQDVYRISYDALGENEREIFLYIACFHKGENVNRAKEQLDACGLFADSGINVLIDMSLISIEGKWRTEETGYLWMHDLIQEMGWAIEREQAKPGKRSRLWTPEDICYVLENNKGSKKVQSISLNLSQITKLNLTPQAFKNMCNLKFLKLYGGDRSGHYYYPWNDCNVHFNLHNLEYLPDSLIYLSWPAYTLKYLPSTFSAENLTELSMPRSQLQRLWDEGQKPRNLKRIDLSYSKQLVEVPDLSMSVNIEKINLQGCERLVEIPSYFENLHKLTSLDVINCSNLSVLSDMPCNMVSLELGRTAIEVLPSSIWSHEKLVELNLQGCEGIKKLPNSIWKLYSLEVLVLSGTSIERLPSSIECLSGLKILLLQNCKRFVSLPTSIYKLKSLTNLHLSGCRSFGNFPEILEPMELLGNLSLAGTKFKELPCLIENVVGRKELVLPGCRSFESVPNSILPPSSVILWASMSYLHLSDCTMLEEIPDSIFSLNRVYELNLSGTMIRSIPSTINQASRLRRLDLQNCKRLESLPKLPYLLELIYASGCKRLKTVSGFTTALTEGLDRTFLSTRHIFDNCVSLDENARRTIMDFAHLRNKATVISKKRKRNKATAHHPVPYLMRYEAICSGNEIPKWVSNQMEGSSIDIKLPLHWSEDANFLGLAFCVVVDFSKAENNETCRGESIFKTENGESQTFWSYFQRYLIRCDDDNSDHLVLWYDSLEKVRSTPYSNATEASFHFCGLSSDRKQQRAVENPVERCGVSLLYAKAETDKKKRETRE